VQGNYRSALALQPLLLMAAWNWCTSYVTCPTGLGPYTLHASILSTQLSHALQGKVSLMQLSRSKMGGGIIATLLNLDNLMQ
jgi:hypothetical protein